MIIYKCAIVICALLALLAVLIVGLFYDKDGEDMQEVRRSRDRSKKEHHVRIMLNSSSEQENMQNLLLNIKSKTGMENGDNTRAALEMYYESLKVGKI